MFDYTPIHRCHSMISYLSSPVLSPIFIFRPNRNKEDEYHYTIEE